MAGGWSNGGPRAMVQRLQRREDALFAQGEEIVKQTIEEARLEQIKILEAATTTTGLERMERGQGNGPGRDDTGTMIDSIQTEYESIGSKDRRVFTGRWGWERPEYFLAQDWGHDNIPPAFSLFQSFLSARERFVLRVLRASRGK